jgi:hypothetical protein
LATWKATFSAFAAPILPEAQNVPVAPNGKVKPRLVGIGRRAFPLATSVLLVNWEKSKM